LIWFANTWIIWNERNDRLFRGTQNSSLQLVEKINFFLFGGLKPNPVLFYTVFIIDAKTLFFVRVLANLFLFCELPLYILAIFFGPPCAGRILLVVIYLVLIS